MGAKRRKALYFWHGEYETRRVVFTLYPKNAPSEEEAVPLTAVTTAKLNDKLSMVAYGNATGMFTSFWKRWTSRSTSLPLGFTITSLSHLLFFKKNLSPCTRIPSSS